MVEIIVVATALFFSLVTVEEVIPEADVATDFVMVGEIVVYVVLVVIDGVFVDFDVVAVIPSPNRVEITVLPVSLVFCVVVFLMGAVVAVIDDALLVVGVLVALTVLILIDCAFVVFNVEVVLLLSGEVTLALVVSSFSDVAFFEVVVSETDVSIFVVVVKGFAVLFVFVVIDSVFVVFDVAVVLSVIRVANVVL